MIKIKKFLLTVMFLVAVVCFFNHSHLFALNDDEKKEAVFNIDRALFKNQHANIEAKAAERLSEGRFPSLKELPENAKIYASGDYRGTKTNWCIETKSGHAATLFKIAVNSPDEPVVLVLGAYEPSVWHIGWTKGTKILSVLLSGGYEQKVAGLPPDVPVLTSTDYCQTGGNCSFHFAHNKNHMDQANAVVEKIFGRPIDRFFPPLRGQAVIGQELSDDLDLKTQSRLRQEDFHLPDQPLAGPDGLEESVQKGLIKPAPNELITQHLTMISREADLPEPIIKQHLTYSSSYVGRPAYIVVSPEFIIPAGLFHHAVTFVLPEGMSAPKGPRNGCDFFDLGQVKASVIREKEIFDGCEKPEYPVPTNSKAYAVRPYYSANVRLLQNSQRPPEGILTRLVVNSPSEPVVLFLSSQSSKVNLWYFKLTKGTTVAAIVLDGGHHRIAGLPQDVLVLDGLKKERFENRGCGYTPFSMEDLSDSNFYPKKTCPSFSVISEMGALVRTNDDTRYAWFSVSSSIGAMVQLNILSRYLFKVDLSDLYFAKSGFEVIGNKGDFGDLNVENWDELKVAFPELKEIIVPASK